jgi:hypothetical protein
MMPTMTFIGISGDIHCCHFISNLLAQGVVDSMSILAGSIVFFLEVRPVLEFYTGIYIERHSEIWCFPYLKKAYIRQKGLGCQPVIGFKKNTGITAEAAMKEHRLLHQIKFRFRL